MASSRMPMCTRCTWEVGVTELRCSECRRWWHHSMSSACFLCPEMVWLLRVQASVERVVDGSLEDWTCNLCVERAAGSMKWDRASPTVPTGVASRPKSKQRDRKQRTTKPSLAHASSTEVIDLTSDSPPQTSKLLPIAPPEPTDTRFSLNNSTQLDLKPQIRPPTAQGPSTKTFAVPYLEAIVTNAPRRSKYSTVSPSPAPIFTPSPRGTSATSTSPPTSPSPDLLHAAKVSITPAEEPAKVVCGFVKSGGQLKLIYREPLVTGPFIPPESRNVEQVIVPDEDVLQDGGMDSIDMDIESSDVEMVDCTDTPIKVEPIDSMDDSLPRIPWHEKGKAKEKPLQVASRITSSITGDNSTIVDVTMNLTSTRPRKMKKTKKLRPKHRERLDLVLVRGEVVIGHI